jgi:hypothetical protein
MRLLVEAAVVGRKRAGSAEHELRVSLPTGPTTLRALIAAIVRAEVAAFVERGEDERLVRVLTQAALDEGLASGAVRSGGREHATAVDPEAAVQTALEAQQDGLFQAFIEEDPVDDLDAVIEMRDGTRVMFLRLVPLAGG